MKRTPSVPGPYLLRSLTRATEDQTTAGTASANHSSDQRQPSTAGPVTAFHRGEHSRQPRPQLRQPQSTTDSLHSPDQTSPSTF
ncbi:hypothetical protein DPMN_166827 [Dreissena polymorpha]|uniref:Uncharacterized protein n=1 Tax=Dreissena polymorpha TaxID=45954 RepID=A0A9D4EXP8_DREPO|nr:hypothetical protein DPMN_166827 [Dreissena polymorpha]